MRAFLGIGLGLLLLAACSDGGAGPSDAGPSSVNGCGDADYVTGQTAIDWTFAVNPRCVEIHAGDSVTWNGDFTLHPLAASGGDTPSPIEGVTNTGTTKTFTFNDPGTFGFHCLNHASMIGAVRVLP